MTLRRAVAAALGIAALLAAAAALAWSQRIAIAERWLAARVEALGVAPAALRVTALDRAGIAVESIAVGAPADPDLAIERVDVAWSWNSLRAGRFVSVRVRGVRLRARIDATGLHAGALDPLLARPGDAAEVPVLPAPEIAIDDGHVRVETPQGPATGTLGGALHETDAGIEGAFALDLAGAGATARGRLTIAGTLAAPRFRVRLDPLRAGDLALRLDARGRAGRGEPVAIEQATLRIFGGALRVDGVSLDPDAKQTAIAVRVEGVDLAPLLALAAVEGLAGTGRLEGALPLVRTGDGVRIEAGALRAAAGGTIRYTPTESVRSLAASRPQDLGIAIQALTDFHYEILEAKLTGDLAGALAIALHVRGANPGFENGRIVELNLNLESRLADLVRSGVAAYRVPERVEQRLREGSRATEDR